MNALREHWLKRENWTFLYTFYNCSEDPRHVVPRPNRYGVPKWWLGTVFNIGHGVTWLVILLFSTFVFVPLSIGILFGASPGVLLALFIGTLLLEWRIAWSMASEER